MVIIGFGFVGAEAAATVRNLGHDVTVIDTAAAPLSQAVGPEVGAVLARLHESRGVRLLLGRSVLAADGSQPSRLILNDGTVVDADLVLVAVGARPAVGWLSGSGLDISDGVACSADLSVGPAGVFAAGDIARWPNGMLDQVSRCEHRSNAMDQGRRAAANLVRGSRTAYLSANYVWSDQFGRRLQLCGTPRSTEAVLIAPDGDDPDRDAGQLLVAYRANDRLSGVAAIGLPRAVAVAERLLGDRASWDEGISRLRALT
jgi:NADPH-dependent 2,4-dienoyl-CoA reductase/sulfur reductase-like enzyme